MTESESRALTRTTAILVVAAVVRWGAQARVGAPVVASDSADALPGLLVESRRERDEEARRHEPLSDGETIDPNAASEVELDRLPGVGPSAARAIVAAREAGGGFAAPEDLLQVRGIGPATLERIRPYLAFSRASARVSTPPGPGPPARVELNGATREALETLPGVGPALAGRILEERERRGGFSALEDLLSVRGIGPATLERLRPLVLIR